MNASTELVPGIGGLPPLCGGPEGGDPNWGPQCPNCPWLKRVLPVVYDKERRELDNVKPEDITTIPLLTADGIPDFGTYRLPIEQTTGVNSPDVRTALDAAREEPCEGPRAERRFRLTVAGKTLRFGRMVLRCGNAAVPERRFKNGYPGRWFLTDPVEADPDTA